MSTHPDRLAPTPQLALPQFDLIANGLHGGTHVSTNRVKFFKTGEVDTLMPEVNGYRELLRSPLADHIPRVNFTRQRNGELEGVLITDSCGNVLGSGAREFRKLMATGEIDPTTATNVLDQYMKLSLDWIESNKSNPATELWPFLSMQRKEWEEVQRTTVDASKKLAPILGLSEQEFTKAPLIVNGIELPSIMTIRNGLNNLYNQSPLEMVAGDLDMSPKNTIVNSEGEWMRIDAEYVGKHDLAEAAAIVAKGDKTTSTAQNVNLDVQMGDDGIHISPSYSVSRAAKAYTERGLQWINDIQSSTGKPFRAHTLMYMAGNSMHEGAFNAKKTDHPEHAFLSFAFAAENMALASGQISEPVIQPTSVF